MDALPTLKMIKVLQMFMGGGDHFPSDFHYTFEDYGENAMPIITLEVISNPTTVEDPSIYNTDSQHRDAACKETAGVDFIIDKPLDEVKPNIDITENKVQDIGTEVPKARSDLLEYMMRNDGSVICKLCGEILQSRTHWYRHKYKQHVIQPLNPAPLFQCEQCLVYFKSRKGYIGHIASRHSEILADASPVLTNSQVEAMSREKDIATQCSPIIKEELDPEMSIPKTSVLNYQTTYVKQTATKATETKKTFRNKADNNIGNNADWEKRSREEKLVADIIDRVRRECEAQGSSGPTRRGYSRRTTVMNT